MDSSGGEENHWVSGDGRGGEVREGRSDGGERWVGGGLHFLLLEMGSKSWSL